MPRKKVRVRDHDRRKPHQEDLTHVDKYVREQELRSRDPPGAAELGPHEMDQHECEGPGCNVVGQASEMVRMPDGAWFCKTCAEGIPKDIDEEVEQIQAIERELHPPQSFLRIGETEDLERGLLSKFNLEQDYDSFDQVPKEILDKIKCPHCSKRQFSLWAEPESYGIGSIDLDKGHLEENDHDYLMDMASQGGHPLKLVCDNCSSEFGSLESG